MTPYLVPVLFGVRNAGLNKLAEVVYWRASPFLMCELFYDPLFGRRPHGLKKIERFAIAVPLSNTG